MEIQNAIIESVTINRNDYNCLTIYLNLELEIGVQSFGGFALYLPKSFKHHKLNGVAGHFMFRVMEIAGVTDWNKLKGKAIRIKGNYTEIYGIGHIIKDDWFDPEKEFKEFKEKN